MKKMLDTNKTKLVTPKYLQLQKEFNNTLKAKNDSN